MDIKQIQCFISVADDLNFTSAAEKLYISQPSLSRHIHLLEDELGIILFKRNNKNVELTSAGIQLLATAKKIVGTVDEFINSAVALRSGRSGKLRIGYQGSTSAVMPKIISYFSSEYPYIDFSIDEYGAKELIQNLGSGEIDLAVIYKEAAEGVVDYSGMHSKKLCSEKMVLFLGDEKYKRYINMSKDRPLSLSDFSDETFFMINRSVNPGYYDYLQHVYMEHSLLPHYPVQQPALLTTLMLHIRANLGVAFLPQNSTKYSNPDVHYIELRDVDRELRIDAVWNPDNFNPSLHLLTDMLEAADAELSAKSFEI